MLELFFAKNFNLTCKYCCGNPSDSLVLVNCNRGFSLAAVANSYTHSGNVKRRHSTQECLRVRPRPPECSLPLFLLSVAETRGGVGLPSAP